MRLDTIGFSRMVLHFNLLTDKRCASIPSALAAWYFTSTYHGRKMGLDTIGFSRMVLHFNLTYGRS